MGTLFAFLHPTFAQHPDDHFNQRLENKTMRRILTYLAFIGSFLVYCHPAIAANPEAAKATATSVCAGCHGPKGISLTPAYPNLAGQKEEYLIAQLKALRDKTRVAPMMNGFATNLKDEDIANLAAYFATLKACE
jgi:cytochrome c553